MSSLNIKVAYIPRLYHVLALLTFAISSALNLRGMEHGIDDGGGLTRIFTGFTFLVWAFSFLKLFIPKYEFYKPTKTVILYCFFFLWTAVPTLLGTGATFSETIFNLLWVLYPMLVLVVTFNTSVNCGYSKSFWRCYLVAGLLFLLQYINVYREINFWDAAHLICSYYVLYVLPLILTSRRKHLRIIAIVLVILVLFSSLKRTGVLALAIGLFVFLFVSQYVENRFRIKSMILSLLAIVAFGGLFVVLGTSGDETLLERFENIDKDNGSGRLDVWEHTATMISRQAPGTAIIGNGYNTVVRDSNLTLSAHNDFLEVTYDYGIIGFFLYICAFGSLFLFLLKMIFEKSRFAPSMSMLFTIYLISSLISHIIIYYWASLFMLSFGYMMGLHIKERNNQLTDSLPEDASIL